MFDFLAKIAAHVLSWLFVIGGSAALFWLFPSRLINCLACCLRGITPDELNPGTRS